MAESKKSRTGWNGLSSEWRSSSSRSVGRRCPSSRQLGGEARSIRRQLRSIPHSTILPSTYPPRTRAKPREDDREGERDHAQPACLPRHLHRASAARTATAPVPRSSESEPVTRTAPAGPACSRARATRRRRRRDDLSGHARARRSAPPDRPHRARARAPRLGRNARPRRAAPARRSTPSTSLSARIAITPTAAGVAHRGGQLGGESPRARAGCARRREHQRIAADGLQPAGHDAPSRRRRDRARRGRRRAQAAARTPPAPAPGSRAGSAPGAASGGASAHVDARPQHAHRPRVPASAGGSRRSISASTEPATRSAPGATHRQLLGRDRLARAAELLGVVEPDVGEQRRPARPSTLVAS